MYSKIFVSVLFSILFALAAVAAPQPDPQLGLPSVFSSIESVASSAVVGAVTTVTSVGGEAVTVISGAGGEAFTLATSGAGVVTSVFGSLYTVATAAIEGGPATTSATSATSASSAFVPHAGVQTSLLVALGSMFVSALLGMVMTL